MGKLLSTIGLAFLLLLTPAPALADEEEFFEDGDGAGMFSPMMNAAQMDDWDTVRRLARTECPDGTFEPDMTVLHHAAMRADDETVLCLIQAGADQTVRDSYGKLPYDYALKTRGLTTRRATRSVWIAAWPLSISKSATWMRCLRA